MQIDDDAYLVSLSGGLDSTTALYKILTETDKRVHVHHVRYITKQNRHDREAQAVSQIVPHLRQTVRDFDFSQSIQDYSGVGHGTPHDLHMYSFALSQVVRLLHPQRFIAVVTGLVSSDITPEWRERRKVANALFDAAFADYATPAPQWLFPCVEMTKAEEISLIGPYLYNLTWSCRRPIQIGEAYAACGRCKTCLETAAAERIAFGGVRHG